MEVGQDQEDSGGEPGGAVAARGEQVAVQAHAGEGAEDAGGHFHDAAHEGQEGAAAALHGVAEEENIAERNKEDGALDGVGHSPGHEGAEVRARGEKEPQEEGKKGDGSDAGRDGVYGLDPDGGADALPDAGEVFFAEILAAEGGHGLAHGDHFLREDVLDPPGGGEGGDGGGAEHVDRRLHDDGAGGGDGKLQGHGDAHAQLVLRGVRVQAPVGTPGEEDPDPGKDIEQAEGRGDRLGQDRREGGAVHAHAEPDDEKDVQGDVEAGGEDQEKQGGAAVADGAQEGREEVVEHGGSQSPADDQHVGGRVGQDVGGRVHECQKARDDHKAQQGQEGGEEDGQEDPVGDADPHAVFIAGAEALGGQDREAGGQAHGKSEQQKRNRARGADGGQRRGPQKTADNDGIRHAVELLENIPQKEGKGKPQNDRQDPAGGHILLHRGNLRDDRDNVSGFIRRGNVIHSTPVS